MDKIGINKCKNDNAQVLAKFIFNEYINIYDLNINQISSTIIENEVLDYTFLESISMVKVNIKVNIKIIYCEYNSNLLNVHEHESMLVEYVEFPKYIYGTSSVNLFIKNKIKLEIFIENITTLLSKNKLLVNFIAILKLTTSPDFYIGINLENNFGDNIYLMYKDCEKIIQTTFELNSKYTSISFGIDDSHIAYIQHLSDSKHIVIDDFKKKRINTIENVNVIKNVNSFTFENRNKILLASKDDGLFCYDIKNDILSNIFYKSCCKLYSNIEYDSKSKEIYFISYLDDKFSLCKINKRKKFEVLFNIKNVIEYMLNIDKTYILILSEDENVKSIYLYHMKTKNIIHVNIYFEYEDILKVNFFQLNKYTKKLIVLVSNKNNKNILIIDLNTSKCEVIFEDENIVDLDVDETTLEVYVAVNKNSFSEIIKIKKEIYTKSSILKLEGNIKKIFLKKP